MRDRNENRHGYNKTKVGWIPEEWGCKKLQRNREKVKNSKWRWVMLDLDFGFGMPAVGPLSYYGDYTHDG